MCLIDTVQHWDDETIVCTSNTHQNQGNPLRNTQSLPISALIEYGAQAMAIHGALLEKKQGEAMQAGYLAALRNVEFFYQGDVALITSALVVTANRKMASQGNMIYDFLIKANDKDLISGRATVVAIFSQ
jgi:predicted hotdog family 3-hydroxylacyl-ACP dehydratase